MIKSFDEIISKVKSSSLKTVAVAVAQDEPVLEAVRDAKKNGIANAILVGDKDEIAKVAAGLNMDLADFEVVDIKDPIEAALKAVELVSSKKADILMKGLIDTKNFLKSVLNKEVGLRTGKLMSHVAVFETEAFDRLIFLTDVAFNTFPDLDQKAQIINNAVGVARAIGYEQPKVACVCAVEVVNKNMPNTVDGEALTKMNADGIIPHCTVQGPLSLDIALSEEAAHHKGVQGTVAGNADILLLPNIEAGNIMYKTLTYFTNPKNGGILVGTSAPVVLTSRADSYETKMYSIALAALSCDLQ
ncbi:phosphate butyryltransferase [Clostridium cellulovorans]|uniref:Phosphate butyryltransferase n=1 Tax=Clostridium cellulovorans (strain ATCC 35296 / DSM 3052 / OCM 3 / 743B) TaxID=573061 RepID=D9SWR3_CLOC7|nr:phosphate butyryltransferase [Clostridium cellulovorans]ADL53345.1 phosphate butyryltransferase [Clostridium cellulovorans 743B]